MNSEAKENKHVRREPWPQIKNVVNHGKTRLLVRREDKGARRAEVFRYKREAEGWQRQQRIKRRNEGGRAFDDRELAAYGWTVADAIRFAPDHLRKQSSSMTLESAMNDLIGGKAPQDEASPRAAAETRNTVRRHPYTLVLPTKEARGLRRWPSIPRARRGLRGHRACAQQKLTRLIAGKFWRDAQWTCTLFSALA